LQNQELVEFEPIVGIQDCNHLVCPNCGSDYLRHRAVRIYNRAEDERNCRKTFVSSDYSQSSVVNGIKNPSNRRDGLTIDFTCEGCSGEEVVAQLCVSQHKGRTEMFWRAA
jgi:hypothetical protein